MNAGTVEYSGWGTGGTLHTNQEKKYAFNECDVYKLSNPRLLQISKSLETFVFPAMTRHESYTLSPVTHGNIKEKLLRIDSTI